MARDVTVEGRARGQRVRLRRKAARLRIVDLARAMAVSPSRVCHIERGICGPEAEAAAKAAIRASKRRLDLEFETLERMEA